MTCHSIRPVVDTPVPDTEEDPELVALIWHSVPSHAIPTSEPVGQLLIRCQSPAPSLPFAPRHREKSDRRASRSTFGVLQLTFHGTAGSATVGHLMSPGEEDSQLHKRGDDLRCVLDLKLDNSKANVEGVLGFVGIRPKSNRNISLSRTLYKTLAVFIWFKICHDALDCDP
jgi:hypothetical protein